MVDASLTGPSRAAPSPIGEGERAHSMDVLRGFALLGILVPNILYFGWPQAAQTDAAAMGRIAQLADPHATVRAVSNAWGYAVTETVFMGKFMFLFATLFGAGVWYFDAKYRTPAGPGRNGLARGAGLWYARNAWLLGLGLFHAFGLWYGDILVWYALSGMVGVWWVRRLRPSFLIAIAALSYLFGTAMMVGVLAISDLAIAGGSMSSEQMAGMSPDAELAAYATGSYTDQFLSRVFTLLPWYLLMPFTFFWQISGLMCLGLALAKLGVYSGDRSPRFYAIMAAVGLPLGAGLTAAAYWAIHRIGSPLEHMYWLTTAQLWGVPLGLGYAGVVLLIVRRGLLGPLTAALGAVGRMALSNYLLQTIVCTTVFYSYGLGLFGTVQFPAIWGVVAAVWSVNILFSRFWLRFFRFGPAEWAWRSLTYLHPQPMLRHPQSVPGAAPA